LLSELSSDDGGFSDSSFYHTKIIAQKINARVDPRMSHPPSFKDVLVAAESLQNQVAVSTSPPRKMNHRNKATNGYHRGKYLFANPAQMSKRMRKPNPHKKMI